jgi:DNA-binding Lrp family transcriptional regulator
MNELDKELLNEIQSDFPVDRHPYKIIGRRLGIEESEVLKRIARLKKDGIIRRLGASINSRRIGFVSTLLAARVPEDRFDDFIETVNSCPGVTHNYQRHHEFNVWFTLIAPSAEDKEKTINELIESTGVDIIELPAKSIFKIKVDFKF